MAGYTATAENSAVTALKTDATWISLHTADPGTTGTSEVTGGLYARKQVTWGGVANGTVTSVAAANLDVPAGVTISYWGLWTASTAGSLYFGGALPAPESFGSAGTYAFTPTLTASN